MFIKLSVLILPILCSNGKPFEEGSATLIVMIMRDQCVHAGLTVLSANGRQHGALNVGARCLVGGDDGSVLGARGRWRPDGERWRLVPMPTLDDFEDELVHAIAVRAAALGIAQHELTMNRLDGAVPVLRHRRRGARVDARLLGHGPHL